MFNTLRDRLILSYAVVVLVCVAVIGLALLILLRSTPVIGRFDYLTLQEKTRVTLQANPLRLGGADAAEVEAYILQLADYGSLRVLLVGGDARTVHMDSYVLQGRAPQGDIPELATSQQPAPASLPTDVVQDARNRRWLFVLRPLGQRGLALAFLRQPSSPLQFLVENFLGTLLPAVLIGVILSVVMAILIARWVSAPLRRLSFAARRIAAGDYDQRVPLRGPREVRALGQSFNEMSARVKAGQQQQKDFLASVSHELKTPLTSIQGYSQAIMDDMGGDPGAPHRFARVINDEAERMRRLVADLLDLARLEAGPAALQREPTDLSLVLHSVAEKLLLRADQRQIAIRTEIDPLPIIVADGDRLAQVVTNLMDNALKHTPNGGAVTLSAKQVGGQVNIAVTDTGKGIPEADLPLIFERFYMVDKSRKAGRSPSRRRDGARRGGESVQGGYGLGLAITREIVEAHGGAIQVQSVEGQGSKFTVTLPVIQPDDTTVVRKRSA